MTSENFHRNPTSREQFHESDLATCVENLQFNLDRAELCNNELVQKLRDVAADLEVIWSRCRYARVGTSSIKTASGFLSAVGGAMIVLSTGPAAPIAAIGAGGIIIGSLCNMGTAKIEHYLSSKKIEELNELIVTNDEILRLVQSGLDQICSLDFQTLRALLRTADRLLHPSHSLYPFFQTVRGILSSMTPVESVSNEVVTLFGLVGQVDQMLMTQVPLELTNVSSGALSVRNSSTDSARRGNGLQRLGGLLMIVTGVITAFTSGQELAELIRTKKSDAVEALRAKADELAAIARPFEFLRD